MTTKKKVFAFIIAADSKIVSGPKNSVTILANAINQVTPALAKVYSVDTDTPFYFNNCPIMPIEDLKKENFDMAILSGVYNRKLFSLSKIITQKSIPYTISPRGSLVKANLHRSALKKIFYLYFFGKSYISRSCCLHFLSVDERDSSFFKGKNNILAPNAIAIKPDSRDLCRKEKIIGFLGRLDIKTKGLDFLLKATSKIKERLLKQNWKIEISGPDFRGNKAIIRKIIREKNLEDVVEVRGELNTTQKCDFLERVSILVQLSRNEGQPQTVLEAMRFGCAILASEGANVSNLLAESGGGITTSTSCECITRSLCDMTSKDLYPTQKQAQIYAEENFSPDKVAQSFYDQLITVTPSINH